MADQQQGDLGQVAGVLRRFGIRSIDLQLPLHQDLVDAVRRVWGAQEGTLNVALSWCWQAELARQSERRARAESEYQRTLGRAIVRYRARGEKSADVAAKRAEAEDDNVIASHLEFRVAEALANSARAALRILEMSNDNYRSAVATQRAQDRFHADDPRST